MLQITLNFATAVGRRARQQTVRDYRFTTPRPLPARTIENSDVVLAPPGNDFLVQRARTVLREHGERRDRAEDEADADDDRPALVTDTGLARAAFEGVVIFATLKVHATTL